MAKETITGAEFIARFIDKYCFQQVFLVTGGACAFIVDALGQNKNLNYKNGYKDNDKDKDTEKIDDKSNYITDNYNKNDKEQLLNE